MPVLRQLAVLASGDPDEKSIEILCQFQMRSRVREAEADKIRFENLVKAIDDARISALADHDGLVERIKTLVLQTKEGSTRQRAVQSSRDTGSVLFELGHAEARLGQLSAQIRSLGEVREQVTAIAVAFGEQDLHQK